MLRYDKIKINELALDNKFLLPLDFSENSIMLVSKPFAFFVDDLRDIHFSYVLDFTDRPHVSKMGFAYVHTGKKEISGFIPANTYEVLKFPTLVDNLLKKQSELKLWFEGVVAQNKPSEKAELPTIQLITPAGKASLPFIYLFKNDSVMLDFIKVQVSQWEKSVIGHKIYNPTVFIPFLNPIEHQSVIAYCRENLINLVVFDFLNFTLKTEIIKTTFKSEKPSVEIIAPTKDARAQLEQEWEKYYTLGANYFEHYGAFIIKNSNELLANYSSINFPSEAKTKFKLKALESFSAEDKLNLAKFYYLPSASNFFNTLEEKNSCGLAPSELLAIINTIKKRESVFSFQFNIKRWNDWVTPTQNWLAQDKKYFLNTLLAENLIEEFDIYSLDQVYVPQFKSLSEFTKTLNAYKNKHPAIWKIIYKFIHENPSLYAPYFNEASVAELKLFTDIIPNCVFNARDFVRNNNFVAVINEFGVSRFIGINNVLHLLSYPVLTQFLGLEHKGISLTSYFQAELPKILNRKTNVCKDTYSYILNNTQGSIEADTFIYNLMLGHNYSQLSLALNEPRLKVKPDTKKLMQLNLLKLRQHPEVSKVLELLD